MDHNSYSLWQKHDQVTLELRKLKNALSKVNSDPRAFQYELERFDPKVREDSSTLSEKRRAELTELLNGYPEPLMDRRQHETHLQAHRKYLERLARYKRQDAIIAGLSPKGINAEEMASYSFAHVATKAAIGTGSGLTPTCGLDPETGEYDIVLKYEGSLEISVFKEYLCRYASSDKVDLYETIKSLFGAGEELGLTKSQLGRLLTNLLDTKEVRESPDALTSNIFKTEVRKNPYKTILKIIQLVSRNTQQAFVIMEALKHYKRTEGTPIDSTINSLETICEEYYRNFYPGASETKISEKVENRVLAMLPDLVDKDVKRQLKKHMKENDNNGVDNNLESMRKFLSKVEGDRRTGGQTITPQALAYMSYLNIGPPGKEKSGRERSSRGPGTRDNRRRRRQSLSGSRASSGTSGSSSARTTPATSRETSSSPRRRGMMSDTSRDSSAHSNVSTPPQRRKEKKEKKNDRKARGKDKDKKKRKEAHYSEKKDGRRKSAERRKSSERPDRCPICYEPQCTNRGKEKCQLRPELIYDPEPNGACGVCRRGYHITMGTCLQWPLKREQMKEQKN